MTSFATFMIDGGLLPLVILIFVALEALALFLLKRRFGIGPGLAPMAGSLLSGGFLVLALYVALVGGPATIILLCLAASFVVHLGDLVWRLRESGSALRPRGEGLRTQGSV
ncbi:MAG: hypothetical protein AAGD23_00300 [Pseudomonadota bacterium]